jgi:hypothetical protein
VDGTSVGATIGRGVLASSFIVRFRRSCPACSSSKLVGREELMRSGSTGFSLEENSDVNGYGTRRMRRRAIPTTTWRTIEMIAGPESRRRPWASAGFG